MFCRFIVGFGGTIGMDRFLYVILGTAEKNVLDTVLLAIFLRVRRLLNKSLQLMRNFG